MLLLLSSLLSLSSIAAGAVAAPRGFVTVKGSKFQLDGQDFYFAGSNAYYFPFNNVRDASSDRILYDS
jgi:mannan endo-1,4-beta-mannosidase